jgi:hypothetical protein
MNRWMRRIRGAIGIGLTWALAWFGAGMILLLVVGFGAADVPFPLFFGLLGFIAGVTFSAILGIVEGRRRFDQMSMPRFALWGAVGGLVLSGVMATAIGAGSLLLLGPIFALSGATCAAGSLALARFAEDGSWRSAGNARGSDQIGAAERKRLGGDL